MSQTARETQTASEPQTARTLADAALVAGASFGDDPALQVKVDGEWRQESFAELAAAVRDLAAGLVLQGVQPGDRVCVLAQTRPEWTKVALAVLAAGGVVVPIYASSSRQECAWVIGNSGASLVVCEGADEVERVESLTDLLEIVPPILAMQDCDGEAVTIAELGQQGADQGTDSGADEELERRRAAVQVDDPAVIIYTSGTTGPPKGCVLTHRNWIRIGELTEELSYIRYGDVVYLFLPLAHVFAQMVQFASVSIGATLVYWGGDMTRIVAEVGEVRPTFLPSVPRIFEKLHAAITAGLPPETVAQATQVGLAVRSMQRRGDEVPAETLAAFEALEPLYAKVRGIFGGRLRQALCGGAPISKDVLEFFHAAGVPVLEGYGLTETTGIGTVNTVDSFKAGSVGVATPGVELRLMPDGEIEMKGPHVFAGYWGDAGTTAHSVVDGWLRTGDLGVVDDDGFVRIVGRSKDIIITSGGKNISPANLENDLRHSPWISQALVYGDRRPYLVALVTLDPEMISAWAAGHGVTAGPGGLAEAPEVRALVEQVVEQVNDRYARAEQIKRFAILPRDLSQEDGELTPSLKVKRKVVHDRHLDLISALYSGAGSEGASPEVAQADGVGAGVGAGTP